MSNTNRYINKFLSLIFLISIFALVLTACTVTDQVGANIADGRQLTVEQVAAQRAAQRGEVLKLDRPYYGSEIIVERGLQHGKPLPEELEGASGVAIKLQGQSDISMIASIITQVSNIPVSVRTRYVIENGNLVEVPITTRMQVNFEGPLSRLLDQIAGRMDVSWTHEDGGIVIDRMITRDYRVPLPTTTSAFSSQLGGATGANIGNTSVSLNIGEESDPWADLETQLEKITPSPAELTVLRSRGRISVFAPPSIHKKVKSVLDDVETVYGQRVGLEIGVYFLDADEAENFGLQTSGFRIGRNIARAGSTIVVGGSGGLLNLGDGTSSVNMEALAEDSSVVDFRLASTIAQSGQMSPISITRQETYIQQKTVESTESGTSVDVTPGQVEHGLSIHALPRIIDNSRIQLFLTILQSDLVGGRVDEIGSGDNTIGAPIIDQRTIQNQSILSPGETLVLSGYEQNLSSTSRTGVGLFKAIGLGGKVNALNRKVRMVVLVRPSLIPL